MSMDCVGNNSIIKPHIKLPHIVRHGAHDQFSRLSPIFWGGEEPVMWLYNTTLSFSYTKHNIVVHLPAISSSMPASVLRPSWIQSYYSSKAVLCCGILNTRGINGLLCKSHDLHSLAMSSAGRKMYSWQ